MDLRAAVLCFSEKTRWFHHTSPMSPDQVQWESLKNTAVSHRSLLLSEDDSSMLTTERSVSLKLTRSTSTEQDTSEAEKESPPSPENEHLLYTAHEVHDYPGHEYRVDATDDTMLNDVGQETSGPVEQPETEEPAEAEITLPAVAQGSDATVTHGNSNSGEMNSRDGQAKIGAVKDTVVVVFPDEADDGFQRTEINEVDGPDAGNKPTELSIEDPRINDKVKTNAESELMGSGAITSSEADTRAVLNEVSKTSSGEHPTTDEAHRKAAIAVKPETASSPSAITTLSGPKADGDLKTAETRPAPDLHPPTPHSSSHKHNNPLSPSLPPADTNSVLSLGDTTTTTVTISDRRLDDTSGELTRLLQDASRSTTVSVTSPDFSNGTFVGQLHGKQNPWLQRYAPFFYPENPLPVTAESLERRQTPAPELRRLRIEHLVLVPPSNYPDEVLRTVHDAKLRALPRPQEDVHVHLGQGEAEKKSTMQKLARGAEYVSGGNVKDVNGGSATQGSRRAQVLSSESGEMASIRGVHEEAVPFGRAPNGDNLPFSPNADENVSVVNQPHVRFQSEPVNALVDYSDFAQPRPEDILPDQSPGRHETSQVNFRPPSAKHESGNGYSAPKPEDIVSAITADQPAPHGDFDHRLPAHVPPISVGFSAPKPQNVPHGDEPSKGHITDGILQPPVPSLSTHSPSTSSSSAGQSSALTASLEYSSSPSPSSSGYSSPKPQDIVPSNPSGLHEPSVYTLNGGASSGSGPNKNSVFAPPKPDDVIPLSQSFLYDAARATAAGVPQEHRNEYGAPKLSSLVSHKRDQLLDQATPATYGLKTTQAVVSELAMKEVAPPELGAQPGYRRPKLIDLLRPSGGDTETSGLGDPGQDGYGTPKPSHILPLSGLRLASPEGPRNRQRQGTTGGKRTLKRTQLHEGFVLNTDQSEAFTRPKPEDVILASGEFVGLPGYVTTRADTFKPDGSTDDTGVFESAVLPAVIPIGSDVDNRHKATNSALDARENSVYYIPSISPSKPESLTQRLAPTASRLTPTSIYDVLASPQPRGLPEISFGDSGAAGRTGGEPSLNSPLYADTAWRPNLSPFAPPRNRAQRAGRRLAEGAGDDAERQTEDEDRWVWPRTTRTAAASGRVLFRDT